MDVGRSDDEDKLSRIDALFDDAVIHSADIAKLPHDLRHIAGHIRELKRNASHDPLTGAGNRAGYDYAIDELWSAGAPFTTAYIDIDNLKAMNDGFGHAEGNRYILKTSRRLKRLCQEGEHLYRIGGDEFVIVSAAADEDELAERLEQCRAQLIADTSDDDHPMVYSFSYGCSRANPAAGDDRHQMVLDADRKMYLYKLAHRENRPRKTQGDNVFAKNTLNDRIFQALSMTLGGRYLFLYNHQTGETRWSTNAVHELGLPSDKPNMGLQAWLDLVHPAERAGVAHELELVANGTWHFHTQQYRIRNAEGDYTLCSCRGYRLDGDEVDPTLYVGSIVNRAAANFIDPVTGLGDSHELLSAIGELRHIKNSAGIIGIRVDGLGRINERYGYETGDRVLAELAGRVVDVLGGRGSVFRSHGVRLAAVVSNVDEKKLEMLQERVRQALEQSVLIARDRICMPFTLATSYHGNVVSQPYAIVTELNRRLEVADRIEGSTGANLPASAADPLTGLPRSDEFLHRAQTWASENAGGRLCLVKIDLGHLRIYNEWYGKKAGDLLISEVGAALKDLDDAQICSAGYWGQDDFSAVLPLDEATIAELFRRVRNVVAQHDDSVGFQPSLGVYPLGADEPIGIDQYSRAAFATDTAKADFKHRVSYFDIDAYRQKERDHELLTGFQRALTQNELFFELQPQCDVETGRMVSAEALARWRRKDGSLVAPDDFIPALESSGFVVSLDKRIWNLTFSWMGRQLQQGTSLVPIAINVSRLDILSIDVATHLRSLAQHFAVPVNLINVEITETACAQDNKQVLDLVNDLHNCGFKVHMDDFGCGVSSLSMLKDMPIDAIKVDRAFLPLQDDNGKSVQIVSSILGMAERLNLPVIVEGVETEGQARLLQRIGGTVAQGFYYGRPMEPDEILELL